MHKLDVSIIPEIRLILENYLIKYNHISNTLFIF